MKIYIAPMAGITDYAFRSILKEFNPDLIFTEMVNANLVNMNDVNTFNTLLKRDGDESVQVFGSGKERLVDAFLKLESIGIKHLELNMGSPKTKIIKTGAGSALLPEKENMTDLLETLRSQLSDNTELSIKIRTGFRDFHEPEFYIDLANRLNLKYICVHGRTREQEYSGIADWDLVSRLSKIDRKIDFIGNGDLFDVDKIMTVINSSNLDGVLLARGIIGNPWLITQLREKLNNGVVKTLPSLDDIKNIIIKHYELSHANKGEKLTCLEMNKFVKYYFKDYPHLNEQLNSIILDYNYLDILSKIEKL